jgi:hypothetical protein
MFTYKLQETVKNKLCFSLLKRSIKRSIAFYWLTTARFFPIIIQNTFTNAWGKTAREPHVKHDIRILIIDLTNNYSEHFEVKRT